MAVSHSSHLQERQRLLQCVTHLPARSCRSKLPRGGNVALRCIEQAEETGGCLLECCLRQHALTVLPRPCCLPLGGYQKSHMLPEDLNVVRAQATTCLTGRGRWPWAYGAPRLPLAYSQPIRVNSGRVNSARLTSTVMSSVKTASKTSHLSHGWKSCEQMAAHMHGVSEIPAQGMGGGLRRAASKVFH